MIKLLSMDKRTFYLNPDLIYRIEETPDTIITLTNGRTLVVENSAASIVELIIEYRKKTYQDILGLTSEQEKRG
nr:flagellar FlbD family protein [Liquorilactobacillus oeni]AJA34200.1 flagellar protein FlbD [Liquorilactobacillus oeni]